MPLTKKFKKMLSAMKKTYMKRSGIHREIGKKKGTSVAFATAKKRGMRS